MVNSGELKGDWEDSLRKSVTQFRAEGRGNEGSGTGGRLEPGTAAFQKNSVDKLSRTAEGLSQAKGFYPLC